jgi:diguanylate cyclase (GGDEF)-like protein
VLKRIIQFIEQDTRFDNEPKRLNVLLRRIYLILVVYYTIYVLLTGFGPLHRFPWLGLMTLAGVVGGFCLTYYVPMMKNLTVFFMILLCWIIGFIYQFGWDCGVQHYLFALLVLFFFAVHDSLGWKAVMAGALFLLRLALFIYCRRVSPKAVLSDEYEVVLQILNSVFLFAILSVICGTYSSNIESAEWKLVEYNERLQMQAATDPLTGIWNRRSMLNFMNTYLERSRDKMSTIVLGDIDHFKVVNDRWGHNCGDAVLVWLTDIFTHQVEHCGVVCRWGGEEFLFFFSDMNGDDAYRIISGIKLLLNTTPFNWNGENLNISMTFGVEEYDYHTDIAAHVERVDEKLYRGKAAGRDQIVY